MSLLDRFWPEEATEGETNEQRIMQYVVTSLGFWISDIRRIDVDMPTYVPMPRRRFEAVRWHVDVLSRDLKRPLRLNVGGADELRCRLQEEIDAEKAAQVEEALREMP